MTKSADFVISRPPVQVRPPAPCRINHLQRSVGTVISRTVGSLALIVLSVAAPAAAQNLTISTPGSYVLGADSTSGAMFNVRIDADDVTFNLNGKTIRCAPSNPSTAVTFGIYAAGRARVTIKNGAITGCFFGVHGGYGQQITVEDVNLSGNTYIGAHVGGSPSSVFRRVRCDGIVGYTVEAYAICINGLGANGLVEDSHFLNLYRQPFGSGVGEGVGILVSGDGTNVIVRRNTFRNDLLDSKTYGVWGAAGSAIIITGNTFANLQFPIASVSQVSATANTMTLEGPIAGSVGITGSTGSASENTISSTFDAALDGVSDGGNTIGTPATAPPPTDGKFFRICTDGVCYEGLLPRVSG